MNKFDTLHETIKVLNTSLESIRTQAELLLIGKKCRLKKALETEYTWEIIQVEINRNTNKVQLRIVLLEQSFNYKDIVYIDEVILIDE